MNSISCRKQEEGFRSEIVRYVNKVPVTDGEGNVQYVEKEPVEPSRAEDFSISANALYGRSGEAGFRLNTDIVDLESNLNKLSINE